LRRAQQAPLVAWWLSNQCPHFFSQLQRAANGDSISVDSAPIELVQGAIGDRVGVARLRVPAEFQTNDGLAHVVDDGTRLEGDVEVALTTLDKFFPTEVIDLIKIDVEGHEAAVLTGAAQLLSNHRARHIIFEEHDAPHSKAFALLSAHGYKLFSLDWRLNGPIVTPVAEKRRHRGFESPNFLATIAPEMVDARFAARGWKCLRDLRVVA
jgi:FkbM family methyltransferase